MRTLLLLAAALLSVPAHAQTVILVRHAEKAAEPKADPLLTPAGQTRADQLAQSLRDAHITHVLTSTLQRTRATAAPTADAAHVRPTPVSIAGTTPAHVADIVTRIKALPKTAVVLVVGHSNTVPLIAAGLGVVAPKPIPDCAYDRMLVVRLGETPSAIASRYGAPSENCAD